HATIVANDAVGLAQYQLHRARIFFPSRRQGLCEFGRSDAVEIDNAVFGFGDDFLTNDENITGLRGESGFFQTCGDERGDIIAGIHHRNPLNRGDAYRSHAEHTTRRGLSEPRPPVARPWRAWS